MILKNGNVLYNGRFSTCDIKIEGEKIAEIGLLAYNDDKMLNDDKILDVSDMYVLPGFIDTHIHGAYGARFSDPNPDINIITAFEATKGVTSIAATTASSEFSDLLRQIDVIYNAAKHNTKGAKIAGIHAEGPFINKKNKGAMNEKYIIPPSVDSFKEMLDHSKGLLKIMTIAPEIENAKDIIDFAVENSIKISIGHTSATIDEADRAIKWGAEQSTHTFNAMRSFNHREPGVLGSVLLNPKVKCEMICDFVHIHPKTTELIYRLKGADNINIVSDSGHAAGMDISEFFVDGQKRYVKNGVVRLEDGTIAGSTKTMLEGVQNLYNIGIPLEDISKMASQNPAKSLEIENETGSISVGKYADIVILDKNLQVKHTFINGKKVV